MTLPTTPDAEALLLAACALHAGFQSVVTVLVYPALAEVPTAGWRTAHDRHSRRITPIVGAVYAAVLAACGLALARTDPDAGLVLALGGTGLALATTALAAAPLHGRLGALADPAERGPLVARLLVVDRVRWAGTLIALAGALLVLA
ncbi:hypothetical protein K8Z61_15690 [Nocardioides sp. TRM66260-LWL]|uniref:hypothetical protein n=1 Tax=Nocardioides sp. TRM66260-LWL TaxID=2874478 RepID=UPI001CC54B3D|nr:hypothetical protein [Nocardioides sp. TRM66260-LWL]MBZ5735936.1 hypothetical protein [Nocardioides sp. TRM66260-LWL]